MPSLAPDYSYFDSQTLRLLKRCNTLSRLDPSTQKLVAEIILLRLFSLFENLVSAVPAKLVAGAQFLDGTQPALIINARSVIIAQSLFKAHGRRRPRNNCQWSNTRDIKDNVKYVIAAADNFITTVDRFANHIAEVRRVRNRIAHNNPMSRKHYRLIVRRYYGACLNNVTPGTLLLTPRISPRLIDQYIKMSRIFSKDLVKG